jgi:uncharacterized protein
MIRPRLRVGPRGVYVRDSSLHGLGVFAAVPHQPGALLEVSPVLVVPRQDVPALRRTPLATYYFCWPKGSAALALGYGSLYNHSYRPRAGIEYDVDNGLILFMALQPIEMNQEITINYHGNPADTTPVWFTVAQ